MRTLLIIILICLISCQKKGAEFIYGRWELGVEDGMSEITITPDKKITWNIGGFKYLNKEDFSIVKKTKDRITIEGEINNTKNDCFRLTFEIENEHQAIICNYKCYINKLMIDEVSIARKNGIPISKIAMRKSKTITIPEGFVGEFYIVYNAEKQGDCHEIGISTNGIGNCEGKEQIKQIFNSNRTFKYADSHQILKTLNTKDYRGEEKQLVKKDQKTELIVIQKGFNQSPRETWNSEKKLNIPENINIEYFEILKL